MGQQRDNQLESGLLANRYPVSRLPEARFANSSVSNLSVIFVNKKKGFDFVPTVPPVTRVDANNRAGDTRVASIFVHNQTQVSEVSFYYEKCENRNL